MVMVKREMFPGPRWRWRAGAFAWSSGVARAEPNKGGTLGYATVSGLGTLDPHVSSSAVELEVIHNVFEDWWLWTARTPPSRCCGKGDRIGRFEDLYVRAARA